MKAKRFTEEQIIGILKCSAGISRRSTGNTDRVPTLSKTEADVLKAIGLSDDETFQTIRLWLGKSTDDAKVIANIINQGISSLI